MGYYINRISTGEFLPAKGKLAKLLEDGATVIETPKNWTEGLVCLVDNGLFEAAGYAYSPAEMFYFIESVARTKRVATWLLYDKAKELAN